MTAKFSILIPAIALAFFGAIAQAKVASPFDSQRDFSELNQPRLIDPSPFPDDCDLNSSAGPASSLGGILQRLYVPDVLGRHINPFDAQFAEDTCNFPVPYPAQIKDVSERSIR